MSEPVAPKATRREWIAPHRGFRVYSLGCAPVFTLTNDLILELGGAVGIAMLGSIGTAVYRSRVGTAIPENISPAFAEPLGEPWEGPWLWPS